MAQNLRDVELISLAFHLLPSRYQLLDYVALVEGFYLGDKITILLPLSLSPRPFLVLQCAL